MLTLVLSKKSGVILCACFSSFTSCFSFFISSVFAFSLAAGAAIGCFSSFASSLTAGAALVVPAGCVAGCLSSCFSFSIFVITSVAISLLTPFGVLVSSVLSVLLSSVLSVSLYVKCTGLYLSVHLPPITPFALSLTFNTFIVVS